MTNDLIPTPDGGARERRPDPCKLGHPPTDVTIGWEPCRCGGHRYYRCNLEGHTEKNRWRHRPEKEPQCAGVHPAAPDGS